MFSQRIVALSGVRALLMQACHPVMLAGFLQHTNAFTDATGTAMVERLARTDRLMNTIYFGSVEQADKVGAAVRGMHARVTGQLPTGQTYRADDPRFLLWTLATVFDSAVTFNDRFSVPLTLSERERAWTEYRLVGELFGLRSQHMPATVASLDDYMTAMLESSELTMNEPTRRLVNDALHRLSPHPLADPAWLAVQQVIRGTLPPAIRGLYRMTWDPVRELWLRGLGVRTRWLYEPLAPASVRYVPDARSTGRRN